MNRPACVSVAACIFLSVSAFAQDYDFQWVTVGAQGNRAANLDEVGGDQYSSAYNRGSVSYSYRITKSKLDVNQYLQFLTAYTPYYTGDVGDIDYLGCWGRVRTKDDGSYEFFPRTGAGHYGARITWEMAARYVNWLHNDKRSDSALCFEQGVYDTSTFYRDANGVYHHQTDPSPGAKFWIPNLDEWIKAVYYDPTLDKYWTRPNSSDRWLIEGLPTSPEPLTETIGDLLWEHDASRGLGAWDLGQYPATQSPWGLIDVSATVADFTSTMSWPPGSVYTGGSLAGDIMYFWRDTLWTQGVAALGHDGIWGGLRIASIPFPSTPLAAMTFFLVLTPRRRR